MSAKDDRWTLDQIAKALAPAEATRQRRRELTTARARGDVPGRPGLRRSLRA